MTASPYRAFTTKFDRIVPAANLDTVIGPLTAGDRQAVDSAWHELQTGLLPWKTKLHVACAAASKRIKAALTEQDRTSTTVSLLFDQSGSMRGQKMLYSAATADVMQEFLKSLRIGCEILGFTTSAWKGGRSRSRWRWRFKPRNPGRLNDLLHIVYRDADDNRISTGDWSFRQMLRPDLPKENIDGEAIEWAAGRLKDRNGSRKILIVLSDGAPVDDSTIMANSPTYLGDHLESVVTGIIQDGEMEIYSFGIGFAPHGFYPTSAHVTEPAELGLAFLHFLTDVLTGEASAAPSTSTE